MKNIIFLDIDGVINDNVNSLSLESVEILKQLINYYNAKIVIISSNQQNGTANRRKKIIYQFENLGIYNIDFIDPNFEGNLFEFKIPSRLLGIIDYLKYNKESNYIILDDDFHNKYKLVGLNFYKTNKNKGLTKKDLPKITLKPVNSNIFNHINYKYRNLGNYEIATNKLIKVLRKKYKNDILAINGGD